MVVLVKCNTEVALENPYEAKWKLRKFIYNNYFIEACGILSQWSLLWKVEFLVMTVDLTNAPIVFMDLMNIIF